VLILATFSCIRTRRVNGTIRALFLLNLSAIYTQKIGDAFGDIVFKAFLGSAGRRYDEHFYELYTFVYQNWTVLMVHA
jgi:hypothetical protein